MRYSIIVLLAVLSASSATAGEFVTNLTAGMWHKEETVREEYSGNVYDLRIPAYDAAFAKEFDLQPKYITETDKGLRFIEAYIITEGAKTNCYFNIVLDKAEVNLDFPEKNYKGTHYPVSGSDKF